MTGTGGIVVERDLMVPACDGVLLATDVYRPASPRLAERKNCPSDEEVVPSPQILAIGKA